ncbi:hypothetical protein C8R45DRAFT_924161 [Mycena sanguinolenta]|nr:hypothetical protein C8R45DRAFT_924161 [Mycena sanguinolenta]
MFNNKIKTRNGTQCTGYGCSSSHFDSAQQLSEGQFGSASRRQPYRGVLIGAQLDRLCLGDLEHRDTGRDQLGEGSVSFFCAGPRLQTIEWRENPPVLVRLVCFCGILGGSQGQEKEWDLVCRAQQLAPILFELNPSVEPFWYLQLTDIRTREQGIAAEQVSKHIAYGTQLEPQNPESGWKARRGSDNQAEKWESGSVAGGEFEHQLSSGRAVEASTIERAVPGTRDEKQDSRSRRCNECANRDTNRHSTSLSETSKRGSRQYFLSLKTMSLPWLHILFLTSKNIRRYILTVRNKSETIPALFRHLTGVFLLRREFPDHGLFPSLTTLSFGLSFAISKGRRVVLPFTWATRKLGLEDSNARRKSMGLTLGARSVLAFRERRADRRFKTTKAVNSTNNGRRSAIHEATTTYIKLRTRRWNHHPHALAVSSGLQRDEEQIHRVFEAASGTHPSARCTSPASSSASTSSCSLRLSIRSSGTLSPILAIGVVAERGERSSLALARFRSRDGRVSAAGRGDGGVSSRRLVARICLASALPPDAGWGPDANTAAASPPHIRCRKLPAPGTLYSEFRVRIRTSTNGPAQAATHACRSRLFSLSGNETHSPWSISRYLLFHNIAPNPYATGFLDMLIGI